MNTKVKEYNERYYLKKAIQYLNEKGVEINQHSIKRAINYFKAKNNSENYKKYKAKVIDSSFIKFVNDYQDEVYCGARF